MLCHFIEVPGQDTKLVQTLSLTQTMSAPASRSVPLLHLKLTAFEPASSEKIFHTEDYVVAKALCAKQFQKIFNLFDFVPYKEEFLKSYQPKNEDYVDKN